MKAQDVTIEVSAKLTVDKKTADVCLKLVEMYVNQTGANIIANRNENGEMEFNYEPVI